jgi:YggT family protein
VSLICALLQVYVFAIFGRIVLSWFPLSPGGAMASIFSFLFSVTEPVLGPVRRLLPPVRLGGMGLDFSPIVVLFGVQILAQAIC